MTGRTVRTVTYRVSRADRAQARDILDAVPGFTVDYEGPSSDVTGSVVLLCVKDYDTSDAAALLADVGLAEEALAGAGIKFVNLGYAVESDRDQDTSLMAVSRETGEPYGRIVGRRVDEVAQQLQRIAELYGVPLKELDVLPNPD